ncbi:MarR family winged helix-turn-helix transcriptional regulator [Fodinicurvata halophila]|uniref:MarR family winged helix-turn-helix transcriptional regulator n=1 Tax=Fodinicurvata halophila TaxID=1419723 RepID=A0ABV8UKU7_9PROT
MESDLSGTKAADKNIANKEPGRTAGSSVALWPSLMACHNLISGEIRLRLRRKYSLTLPRYELMAQLNAQEEGLSMGELSRRLMVSNGNITGITDRLVSEDLVVRYSLPSDRRTHYVKLTPKGQEILQAISKSYNEWLEEFLEGIGPDQAGELDRLLRLLRHSVNTRINLAP